MSEGFDYIFEGFSFNTELIFAGRHCDVEDFEVFTSGVIHFVKEGFTDLEIRGMNTIKIREPSLIFFPRPSLMRFMPIDEIGMVLICAHTTFNVDHNHPVPMSFPDVVVIELNKISTLKPILDAFFEEALSSSSNYKKQATDKLSALILIYMTRYLIAQNVLHRGLISAMSNNKVAKSLEIIHGQYNIKLTLDSVAKEIGISRSQFAVIFSNLVSQTFYDYLTSDRVRVAQRLILEKKSIKVVAAAVGFSSSSAFIRKFKDETGTSPGKWTLLTHTR